MFVQERFLQPYVLLGIALFIFLAFTSLVSVEHWHFFDHGCVDIPKATVCDGVQVK